MPQDTEEQEPTTTQLVRQISAQLAALNRSFRRIIDLDEGDQIDRAILLTFRDAFAYAVKMKGRESETEDLLQWVRDQKKEPDAKVLQQWVRDRMKDEGRRKASWWGAIRTVGALILGAIATALAARYLK